MNKFYIFYNLTCNLVFSLILFSFNSIDLLELLELTLRIDYLEYKYIFS